MLATSRLSKFILSNAVPCAFRHARKVLNTNTIRCSSILTRVSCAGSVKSYRSNSKHSILCSKTCCCGIHHKLTEGDHDLVTFLEQEIDFEKESMQDLPKPKDFKITLDGSLVTLSKKQNGERIVVSFDINENMNIDESLVEEEGEADVEGDDVSNIVSYPSFKVQIIKESGKTLQLSCVYESDLAEEGEEQDDDNIPEIFRFDSVSVMSSPDADVQDDNVYEAEAENMDSDLYKMLLNTLYERGVNNEFTKDLLEISTTVEHKQYVNFLQDLKGFFGAKN